MQQTGDGWMYHGRFWATACAHVIVARQQIFNNATDGQKQWKSCVFYMVRAEML
jgi:hypothetical protein